MALPREAGPDSGPATRVAGLLIILLVALLPRLAAAEPRAAHAAGSDRDCTTCHIEWIEAPDKRPTLSLIEQPDRRRAGEGETCLGCHDGSAGDARREVWLEHGHRTGVAPPPGMKVPEHLPLEDGKLACRTCHTAHQAGDLPVKDVVFLRMKNDAGQLCKACHTDKAGGMDSGSHPLACQSCHAPHGSRTDYLLLSSPASAQLCTGCHDTIRPAMWMADGHGHPPNPKLSSAEQVRAIKEMGTRLGEGNTLVCLSCHRMHGGAAGRSLLVESLTDSRFCLRCHSDRQDVLGSSHDLRKSAPKEKNRLGQTAEQSGPCGSCHTFHSYTREPVPAPGDPSGLCVTCHGTDKLAAHRSGQPFSHPTVVEDSRVDQRAALTLYPSDRGKTSKSLGCMTCHNPHEAKRPYYLRDDRDAVCASCHRDKVESIAAHDLTGNSSLRNARGQKAQETGKCGFCHAVHDAVGPAMWVATKDTPRSADQMCISCHAASAWEAGDGQQSVPSQGAMLHPRRVEAGRTAASISHGLPLGKSQGAQTPDRITCKTCHDPHAGSSRGSLLRISEGASATGVCAACHGEAEALQRSLHSPDLVENKSGRACGPCHSVHATQGSSRRLMWAAARRQDAPSDIAKLCLGCHSTDGGAKPVTAFVHVEADFKGVMSIVNDPTPMQREFAEAGQITCATCHAPHGRGLPPLEAQESASLTKARLRAHKPMLRPNVARELCSTCHGADATRVYLYAHHPKKLAAAARLNRRY